MFRDDFAIELVLRIVRRHRHGSWIRFSIFGEFGCVVFPAFGLNLKKERLMLLQHIPTVRLSFHLEIGIGRIFVPNKVVVCLAVIVGRVAIFLHDLW